MTNNCIILHSGNCIKYFEYVQFLLYQLNKINIDYDVKILTTENIELCDEEIKKWLTINKNLRIIIVKDELNVIGMSSEMTDNYNYSRMTFLKLCSPLIKELQSYEKMLYLDTDIVIKKDFSDIFNIDMSDKFIGCVEDYAMCHGCNVNYPITKLKQIINDLNDKTYGKNTTYYNGGVVLFNNIEIQKRLDEYIKLLIPTIKYHYETHFPFLDQDLINVTFEIFKLPNKYNRQPQHENCDDSIIEHYTSVPKCTFEQIMKNMLTNG